MQLGICIYDLHVGCFVKLDLCANLLLIERFAAGENISLDVIFFMTSQSELLFFFFGVALRTHVFPWLSSVGLALLVPHGGLI